MTTSPANDRSHDHIKDEATVIPESNNATNLEDRAQATQEVVATAAAVSSSSTPLQLFVDTLGDSQRHLVAAAVARGTSVLAMYPVDTIKTRMQMGQLNPLRMEGIFGGVLGSLVGQIPYGVLTFGSYEVYKSLLLQRFSNRSTKEAYNSAIVLNPVAVYALAAVLGDLTGSVWLCPSEVLKQQIQGGLYDTSWQAAHAIWENKGVPGFYEGYAGAIFRDVPFRVIQLTTFELCKSWALQRLQQQSNVSKEIPRDEDSTAFEQEQAEANEPINMDLSSAQAAACGAVAGTLAASLTSPLDRIKTLLMTNSEAYGGSVLVCASQIWTEEGWQGLFLQGLVPRCLYIAPVVVIFFVVYEQTQQQLKQQGWGKEPKTRPV